jgi:hypothetical protein
MKAPYKYRRHVCAVCEGDGGWIVPNGKWFKWRGLQLGLSQAAAARMLGCTVVWLFYIETNRKRCPERFITALESFVAESDKPRGTPSPHGLKAKGVSQ